MGILLVVALVLLLVISVGAVAVFMGIIPMGQSDTQVASAVTTAQAQTAQGPGTGAPPTTNAQPPTAGGQAAPPRPKVVKNETLGDWVHICIELPDSTEVRCSIRQQVSDSNTNAVLFIWRILQDGKGGLTSVWTTPENVLLTQGIKLDAGTPEPIVLPFESCGRGRCQAVAGIAADYVDTLSKAEKAVVTIVNRGGQPLELAMSVNGLSDGLAALGGSAAAAPSAASAQ